MGLQNQSDPYAGVLYGGADFAGIFMTAKFEPVTFKLGWAKLYENQMQKTDDATLYVFESNFLPGKAFSVGLNFMYLQDDTGAASGINTKLNPFDQSTAADNLCTRQSQSGSVHPRHQRGLKARPGDDFGILLLPDRNG